MKNKPTQISIFCILILFTFLSISCQAKTPVEKHGQLSVSGTKIINQQGDAIQLAGMSLFWSQWIGKYYNYDCVKWLKDDWNCSVVRAAMGVGHGGYATQPEVELEKISAVIDAAIKLGIYVVVDFHEHKAENYTAEAKAFFTHIAQKYGNTPNIIYEIYNEPLAVSWSEVIKPYAEVVIAEIRKYDPDNIIVCGTPNWSQKVDDAAKDPIAGGNIAYALHFYSGTHKEWLMKIGDEAISKGICLFVTEYGTTEANGDGPVFEAETQKWYEWMNNYKISHCNWSVADKNESSAALVAGASPSGGWKAKEIKPSGVLVRKELARKYEELMK
jgi:endoglucanase